MEPKSVALLVELLRDDQETAFRAYYELEQLATRAGAPDRENERAAVAAALAATLPDQLAGIEKNRGANRDMYTDQVLVHGCMKTLRLLSYVAGPAEVPVLVQALGNEDVREMARFTLDRRVSPETTDALIKALDAVGPTFREGVVGALARRAPCRNCLAALKKLTDDPDDRVAIAAVEALANFPDASSDALIVKATQGDCAKCRARAHKARVRLAETLCHAGDKAAARKIYQSIAGSDAAPAQKKAAEMALKATG